MQGEPSRIALEKDAETLKAILWSLSDGVVVADKHGNFLLFNPEAERMLGMGARDLDPGEWSAEYGCFYTDKVTPFPPDRLPLYRALRGESIEKELIFIRNRGKTSGLFISVSGRPLIDENDCIWGGLVVFRDVTRQERARENLHVTSSWLAAVVENQNTAILVEDECRNIQYINRSFCRLFGLRREPEELIGENCADYTAHARDLFEQPDLFIERVRGLLDNRKPYLAERLSLKDGRVYRRNYIPVYNGNQLKGHVWQYSDVTEEEKKRDNLQLIERLSRALEQTADSVIITDRKGRIEYANQAFETTTGYSREEVIGNNPGMLKSGFHDKDFYADLWKTILAGETFRGTIINRKKTGETYWAEQTITPMKNQRGKITHFVSVLKDVTELLKKKEQEVEMRLVRDIQQQYYRTRIAIPGYDIAASAIPADATGGDYFDFIRKGDDRVFVVIGDVSGHGLSSSVLMAETRACLRALALENEDIGKIVSNVNRLLTHDLKQDRFVTLLAASLDLKKRELSYVSAGHEHGYLLDDRGQIVNMLKSTGPPLGILPERRYNCSPPISLSPKQTLLLFTDGLVDSMNSRGEQLQTERVIDYVMENGQKPAEDITRGICEYSREFAADRIIRDDITSLILKVL